MKKILFLLFITVTAYAQQPTPLMNAYIPGIAATQIIDNRPAQTRRLTYVSLACSGTGTWQAALSYSSSSSGSWTSYGASGIVNQDSTTAIAFGFKLVYPNYIRVLITGTATCNFSGFQNLFPSSSTSGTVTSVTVAGTGSQITATGTCSATDVVTCTFSIPSAFVLPGTINGLTLTTSSGTFTLTNGKTFTVLKTLTFEGTDGVTITFPSTSATVATLGLTNTFTGRQDASGAASTAPNKVGTSLPATCTVGDTFFKSDATISAVLYACTATDTWTQQSGITTGTVTSLTINGTANQISVSGTCTITTTGTCTILLPNSLVLPGTINGLTLTTTTGTFTLTNAKTFTVNNTLTIQATDGTTLVVPDPTGVTTGHCVSFTKSGSTLTLTDDGANCATGTVTTVTISGTANQITATGASCTAGTTVITCTLSIPSAFVLPGTINGLTLTTSTGTITIANGKTVTVSKTLTFDGTDGTTITFPASSATVATLGLTNTFTGRQDASGAASTAPAKVGTAPPGTCVVGDLFFDSNETAGANIYGCTATNTWTLESSGGTGNAAASGTATGCSTNTVVFTATSNTVQTLACTVVATNVTSSTLAGLTAGQTIYLTITQPGGGGSTFAATTGLTGDVAISAGPPAIGIGAAEVCVKEIYALTSTTARLVTMTCSASGTVVQLNSTNTFGASGTLDMSAAGVNAMVLPKNAGSTPSVEGVISEDTTNDNIESFLNGVAVTVPTMLDSALPTDGQCAIFNVASSRQRIGGTTCNLVPLTTGTSITMSGASRFYVCSSTCTITVPVPSQGVQYCVRNGNNVTTVITFAAIGSSAMYENTANTAYGTAGTGTLVSGGAVGDKICIVGLDSTHYQTWSYNGTWTVN